MKGEVSFQEIVSMIAKMTFQQRVETYNQFGATLPELIQIIRKGVESASAKAEQIFHLLSQEEDLSIRYLALFRRSITGLLEELRVLPSVLEQVIEDGLENDDVGDDATIYAINLVNATLNMDVDKYLDIRTEEGFKGPRVSDVEAFVTLFLEMLGQIDRVFVTADSATKTLAILTVLRKHY